ALSRLTRYAPSPPSPASKGERGKKRGLLRRQRLLDLGLEYAFEICLGDRPDQLVGDLAVAADQEGLRHAVDAPFHRSAAVAVGAGRRERIAVPAEEAARVVGLVLVIDADEP